MKTYYVDIPYHKPFICYKSISPYPEETYDWAESHQIVNFMGVGFLSMAVL